MANKSKFICVAAIALSLFVVVQPVSASLVANLINGSNTFQDNSVAYAVASDGTTVLAPNATLAAGDYLVGVAALSENLSKPAGQQTLSGAVDIVFAYQITNIGAPGTSGLGANQVPVTLADGANSNAILTSLLSGSQFAALPSADSYAVISSNNAFNVTTLTRTGSTPATGTFAAINANYVLDAAGNIGTGANNFDQTALNVGYSTSSPGQSIGTEQAVLNMNYHPGFAISPTSTINQLFSPFAVESGDVTLYSPLFVATTSQLTNGWSYADNATVTINATVIPEPATLIVWSLLISAGGLLGIRAARKQKA